MTDVQNSPTSTIYLQNKIFGPQDPVYESLMKIRGISHMTAVAVMRRCNTPMRARFKDVDSSRITDAVLNMGQILPNYLLNERSTEVYTHDKEGNLDVRTFASKVWHRITRTYIGLCISCGRKRHGQRSNRRRNKRKTFGK